LFLLVNAAFALLIAFLLAKLLPGLRRRCVISVRNYPLLSEEERKEQRDYVRAQLEKRRSEEEKKNFLVDYLCEKVKGNKIMYFRERGLLRDERGDS